jgi:antitoxin HicB
MPKTVEEYLSLPYTIVLRRDIEDEIFVARIEELPGCSAHGETEVEALSNLRDNMQLWIADAIESGDAVPEPVEEIELPSGKWLQRVPRSLHLKLIRLAKAEGVSLNQFITAVLAEAAGIRAAESKKSIEVSIAASADEIDPWSLGFRADHGEWETQHHPLLDRRQRDHSLRSQLGKSRATVVNTTRRELKYGDKETHENWKSEFAGIAN